MDGIILLLEFFIEISTVFIHTAGIVQGEKKSTMKSTCVCGGIFFRRIKI